MTSEPAPAPGQIPPNTTNNAIWVISDVAPDGTYVTTIHATDDLAFTLTPTEAHQYAAAVLAVAARADFDAAVVAQLQAAGMGPSMIAAPIADLRAERPDVPFLTPLSFKPLVAAADLTAQVYVLIHGKPYAQWTPADAIQHATQVLQVAVGVDLDAAYRRYLVGQVGLTDPHARAMVSELANHRSALPC